MEIVNSNSIYRSLHISSLGLNTILAYQRAPVMNRINSQLTLWCWVVHEYSFGAQQVLVTVYSTGTALINKSVRYLVTIPTNAVHT